jgi:hypothetical protein
MIRLGYGRQLQVHQEELEDKDDLIKNLYLQNDRLMSEIDDLRYELKSTLFSNNPPSAQQQKPSIVATVSSWVTWFFTPLQSTTTATATNSPTSTSTSDDQPSTSAFACANQTQASAAASATRESEARAREREADANKQSVLVRYWPIVVAIASMVVMIMLKRK